MPPRKRKTIAEPVDDNIYALKTSGPIEFVSTGCTLLDCCLGGGFALGRMANIIGDKSTAKTAIATETVINFLRKYPDGAAYYCETEAAFDQGYAKSLGMPLEKVDFGENPVITVEDLTRSLGAFIGKRLSTKTPGIFVIDSLDAISDEAEMERDISEGTYGTKKASKLSILFRTSIHKIEQARVLLLIVSQIRENLNAMFGEKYKRSGGKALDFYASQFLWLNPVKTLTRDIKKINRPYGQIIHANIKKNKVGNPHRQCDFEFHYSYGIEDLLTSIEFLKKVDRLPDWVSDVSFNSLSDQAYREVTAKAADAVRAVWDEIEDNFAPKRSKYENSP